MSLADDNDAFHILLPISRGGAGESLVVITGGLGDGGFRSFEAAAAFAASRFPKRAVQIRPGEAERG